MIEEKIDMWALVELFGHQRIVGRVTEATIAGGAFLRVDVPESEGLVAYTRYYGPAAIYSINPLDEDQARSLATRLRPAPVHAYQIPMLQAANESQEEEP